MEDVVSLIKQTIASLYGIDADPALTRTDEQFGDYATNIALQINKQVGKPPRDVATEIAGHLSGDAIIAVDVAGPGFINIRLSDAKLVQLSIERPTPAKGSVVIETNNPNPFKAMHIGHALNAITADTVANLLDASGKEVHRVSYHGDVGAHVGKSMYSLLRFAEPRELWRYAA